MSNSAISAASCGGAVAESEAAKHVEEFPQFIFRDKLTSPDKLEQFFCGGNLSHGNPTRCTCLAPPLAGN